MPVGERRYVDAARDAIVRSANWDDATAEDVARAVLEASGYPSEVERLREVLQRIADGEVDGVGDYSECVQLFAQAALDAS